MTLLWVNHAKPSGQLVLGGLSRKQRRLPCYARKPLPGIDDEHIWTEGCAVSSERRAIHEASSKAGSAEVRSMQFPAAGYLHSGGCSPWELRRSHALRGIGRRTRDQSTTRGTRAQRPSARSCEGIKRQGADFLSRSPVLLSPLARLPVPSCCFLIGHRHKAEPAFLYPGR